MVRGGLILASLVIILPLFLVEQVYAGTIVVPNNRAATTSTNNNNSPFGNASASGFVLQIDYAASQLFSVATGSLISSIGFRLFSNSGTITQALNYTAFNIEIGKSANTISGLSRTFASNLGADTIVARSGALTIAAGAFVGNKRLNPFYTIDFTTPYVYEGGDLLVTIRDSLAADTQGTFVSIDALSTSSSIGDVGAFSFGATTGTANFFYAPVTQLGFAPASVPEPPTWAMMIAGLSLVFAVRQHRRQKPAAPAPLTEARTG